MSRWDVRVMVERGEGGDMRGKVLKAFARYTAAKRYAKAHAQDYINGTIIDDTRAHIIDTGAGWCDYHGEPVGAPRYALMRAPR